MIKGPETFDEFLAECIEKGVSDGDRIAYIEWDAGREVKVIEVAAGKAIVNGPIWREKEKPNADS